MKRRLLIPLIAAGVAMAAGVASANPSYWRANGMLAEVSADPRDGTDFVQVNPMHAGRLELVALNDTVTLRGMTVRFSDGRAFSPHVRFVQPGQPLAIDLPPHCGMITGVELDYGHSEYRRYDRTPARLQIFPRADQTVHYGHHVQPWQVTGGYYHQPSYHQPTYQQPAYQQPTYQQPAYVAPTYVAPTTTYYTRPSMRPRRARSTWSIQGSFSF